MVRLIKTVFVSCIVLFMVSCDNDNSLEYDDSSKEEQKETATQLDLTATSIMINSKCINHFDMVKNVRKFFLNHFVKSFKNEKALLASIVFTHNAQVTISGEQGKIPFAGIYVGRAAITELFYNYFNDIDITTCNLQYHIVDKEYASTHIKVHAIVNATGKSIELEYTCIWKYASENSIRPLSCHIYFDTALMKQAFSNGGASILTDLSNPDDDYVVNDTDYNAVEIVQTVYNNFYAGNVEAVLGMISPTNTQIFFKGPVDGFPFAGYYEGVNGILSFMTNLAGTASMYNVEMFMIGEGDRVDVVLFEEWTVFSTGKDFHVKTVNSWRIDDNGKVLGFTSFPDTYNIVEAYAP